MSDDIHPLEKAVIDAENAKERILDQIRSIHRASDDPAADDQVDRDPGLTEAYSKLAKCMAQASEAHIEWAAFLRLTTA